MSTTTGMPMGILPYPFADAVVSIDSCIDVGMEMIEKGWVSEIVCKIARNIKFVKFTACSNFKNHIFDIRFESFIID